MKTPGSGGDPACEAVVPAGRAPERLVGRDAGLVRLKTNREDVPEVKFHVAIESR